MFAEIAVVAVLIVINGLLAMSELAVVSSRPARLKVFQDRGVKAAATALRLTENPGRFLSTVQIGITLVGVLSGAFSGATLGARLSNRLLQAGMPTGLAHLVGVGLVVVTITYLSLIVGELVPKQIALRDPERIAIRVAPTMTVLAKVGMPLVWLLENSGKIVLWLLRQSHDGEEKMTTEEVKTVIAEAESAGVLESDEKDMISGVMRFADRSARALMTPRRDVDVIDLADTAEEIRTQVRATRWSRLPVRDGGDDAIIGVILVKDLFDVLADGRELDFRSLVQDVPMVLDVTSALDLLKVLRASTVHMVLIFDEHGHFEGVVSSGDVLEAITGDYQQVGGDEPDFVVRSDGSFLVSGSMPIDEFNDRIGVLMERKANYVTVAGLVLNELNRLPEVGEVFTKGQWRFEVVDRDGLRVDKVLVSRIKTD